ncbi:MAG: hypothetical protein LBB40_02800 [Holophagales bacterium]|jgi:hypothetical protein|nr:hypothetical protein [Holophagales bacterium]
MSKSNLLTTIFYLALAPATIAAQDQKPPEVDYSKPGNIVVEVPREVTVLKEKTLPYLSEINAAGHKAVFTVADNDSFGGMRNFSIEVLPGEKITASLRAFPLNDFFMNWGIPHKSDDPLLAEIKKINLVQERTQKPKIEFKNTLDKPYKIVLFLQGRYDVPYTITLKREMKK